MTPELPTVFLGYAGYLVWLLAGCFDFRCHRRTDLPHTSGLDESSLHWVQLGLIGGAGMLGAVFEMGPAIAVLLLALVLIHAVVGYLDTRVAFKRRVLAPGEQHLHSVLDMAPWIGLAWLLIATWPAPTTGGWQLELRRPALGPPFWIAVLGPALLLCGLPALFEFRAAWKARRARSSSPQV